MTTVYKLLSGKSGGVGGGGMSDPEHEIFFTPKEGRNKVFVTKILTSYHCKLPTINGVE